jgi:hypothetical protein
MRNKITGNGRRVCVGGPSEGRILVRWDPSQGPYRERDGDIVWEYELLEGSDEILVPTRSYVAPDLEKFESDFRDFAALVRPELREQVTA